MECVKTDFGARCLARHPECSGDGYCKGDTAILCDGNVSGYAIEERFCAPYACVQADGGRPVCVDEGNPCFDLPDGQYCQESTTDAYECLQRGMVRRTTVCSQCYVGADGKARSEDTKAPCL